MGILEGVHPVQAMATRMHELAEGCRKVYNSLRLCFAFSPAHAVAQLTRVLAMRIRPRLVQCRSLPDHAYLMLRDRLVVVCTWEGRVRIVSGRRSGTWLSFSLRHTTEGRISSGPQAIRFDVVSAGWRTRSRGEGRGDWLRRAVNRRGWTRKRKKGRRECLHPRIGMGFQKKDFLGRAGIPSVVVGSRERR